MGNRAVIATQNKDLGVYLHWNGERESIESFLAYCDMKGYRPPEKDEYGWARLCQVIGNFIGGNLSVGIGKYERQDLNNGDNGVYIIKDWDIVDREYADYLKDNENHEINILNSLDIINQAMPTKEQATAEELVNYANKWNKKHIDYFFKNDDFHVYGEKDIENLKANGTITEKDIDDIMKRLEQDVNKMYENNNLFTLKNNNKNDLER